MKSLLIAAALVFLSGAAGAVEIPYSAPVGGAEVSGTVEMDDSSGDGESATGTATGAVSGKFALDGANNHIEFMGAGSKLVVTFSLASQRLSAHLDNCPGPDSCTTGPLVLLWEK